MDVILLQEIWGSQVSILQRSLQSSHNLLTRNKSWSSSIFLSWIDILSPSTTSSSTWWPSRKKEEFATALDCATFWLQANGGLWFAARHQSIPISPSSISTPEGNETNGEIAFQIISSKIFPYSNGTWKLKLGVLATFLDVSSKWSKNNIHEKKYILFLNTHLYHIDTYHRTKERAIQLCELVSTLRGIVLENKLNLPFFNELDWKKQCAVIVAGDFNITYGSPQYFDIIKGYLPEARDILVETLPKNLQIENQLTYDPENSLVNYPDQPSRIDYIFLLDKLPPAPQPIFEDTNFVEHKFNLIERPVIEFLKLRCTKFEILKQSPGHEISDHWPLLAHIQPCD